MPQLSLVASEGLLAAISWPLTLLSVASIIDNPWSICTQRSVNAGRQLAEVLLSRQQGRRPVTLVGFSFGARVIFSCLEEMASRKSKLLISSPNMVFVMSYALVY